jgi:hypothetical protein
LQKSRAPEAVVVVGAAVFADDRHAAVPTAKSPTTATATTRCASERGAIRVTVPHGSAGNVPRKWTAGRGARDATPRPDHPYRLGDSCR